MSVQAPRAVFSHWCNQRENRVELPRVFIPITMRCTLNCDKCVMHLADLKSRRNIPVSAVIDDIRALLACVDSIYHLFLAGGEPFLHPQLDEIIRFSAQSGKAKDISVLTNGTVIPDEGMLTALREAQVSVHISRYRPSLQPNIEKLTSILKENGIHYVFAGNTFWYDTSGFGQRQEGDAKHRFSMCYELGLCYFRGKLHLCAESAMLLEEGLIPDCKEDYINVRAAGCAAFRAQVQTLPKRSASACAYCLGHTYKSPRVPVAEQRKREAL